MAVKKTASHPSLQKVQPPNPEPTVADLAPPAIEDPSIDKVIDDIVMSESNEVLAAEDAKLFARGTSDFRHVVCQRIDQPLEAVARSIPLPPL